MASGKPWVEVVQRRRLLTHRFVLLVPPSTSLLLPSWPKSRVLDLAPVNWKQTLEQQDTQQRLDAKPFRTAILALDRDHPDDE